MNKYPTKRKILNHKPEIKEFSLLTLQTWKKECLKGWNKNSKNDKLFKLKFLIKTMNDANNGELLEIKNGKRYCYDTKNKIIYQNTENPSIISALHELAHHLLGPDELKTCAWSIHHFIFAFPKQYKNLKWKKHLLVKK